MAVKVAEQVRQTSSSVRHASSSAASAVSSSYSSGSGSPPRSSHYMSSSSQLAAAQKAVAAGAITSTPLSLAPPSKIPVAMTAGDLAVPAGNLQQLAAQHHQLVQFSGGGRRTLESSSSLVDDRLRLGGGGGGVGGDDGGSRAMILARNDLSQSGLLSSLSMAQSLSSSSLALSYQQQQLLPSPPRGRMRPKLVRVDVYCQLEGYLEQLRPLINPRLLQRFHLDEYHCAPDNVPHSPKANGAILTLYSSTDRWKERLNGALVARLNGSYFYLFFYFLKVNFFFFFLLLLELYTQVCLVLLKPVSDPNGLSYIGSKGQFVAIKQLCVSEEGVYDIPYNRTVLEEVLHLLEPRGKPRHTPARN